MHASSRRFTRILIELAVCPCIQSRVFPHPASRLLEGSLSASASELQGHCHQRAPDAILSNPTNSIHSAWLREANAATRSLRLQLQALEARTPEEFESAFAALTRQRAGRPCVLWSGPS